MIRRQEKLKFKTNSLSRHKMGPNSYKQDRFCRIRTQERLACSRLRESQSGPPSFFLCPARPTFLVPFTFATSARTESLEQAKERLERVGHAPVVQRKVLRRAPSVWEIPGLLGNRSKKQTSFNSSKSRKWVKTNFMPVFDCTSFSVARLNHSNVLGRHGGIYSNVFCWDEHQGSEKWT